MANQVNFPRIEFVLKGEVFDKDDINREIKVNGYDVLYIPPRHWNFQNIFSSASVLSILFGKQQMVFSFQEWNEGVLTDVYKCNVARAFYISSSYLSQVFQNNHTIGFNEYLNNYRLEYAKNLLKEYDLKVKEIGGLCGFVDINYFCRLFRKKQSLTI